MPEHLTHDGDPKELDGIEEVSDDQLLDVLTDAIPFDEDARGKPQPAEPPVDDIDEPSEGADQ